MDEKNLVMAPKQVAEFLQISRSSAYAYIKKGIIPSFQVGGSVRVDSRKLMKWIEAGGTSLREARAREHDWTSMTSPLTELSSTNSR